MQLNLGTDFFEARNGKTVPVQMTSAKLINGHVLLVGSSGVGKSYTLRRMISDALKSNKSVRFHIFDVHGDLEVLDASTVVFSEQAPYGLNPFVVNPDVHFGGVRKCVQSFIRVINQASSTALGLKQESVLRNILYDVYHDFGFDHNDPDTWDISGNRSKLVSGGKDNRLYLEVPHAEKDKVKALGGRWDPDRKLWWVRPENYAGDLTKWPAAINKRNFPTLADVTKHAKRVYLEKFLGSDQRAIRELGHLNKKAKAMQRKLLAAAKNGRIDTGLQAEAQEELEAAKQDAVEAYTSYVDSVRTGEELGTLLKYDSGDVVKSVVDRLENLLATGIYKDKIPPFDPGNPVWRYSMRALSKEEKKMMVLFLLQDIFNRAVQRGEQPDVVEVVVLDEFSTYTSSQDENGDGIIGIVAREARKFGLAMWAANQTPNVPESLISSVSTKIILGLDEMYWNAAGSKLKMEKKLLSWIQPHHTMAVQMKEKGALKNRWWWVKI